MSLYANLLDSKGDSSASISSAPVLYAQAGTGSDSKDDAAAKKAADPGTSSICPDRGVFNKLTILELCDSNQFAVPK